MQNCTFLLNVVFDIRGKWNTLNGRVHLRIRATIKKKAIRGSKNYSNATISSSVVVENIINQTIKISSRPQFFF